MVQGTILAIHSLWMAKIFLSAKVKIGGEEIQVNHNLVDT